MKSAETTLIDRMKHALQAPGMLPESGPLVIGVSGGPDSLALLHILSRLQDDLGLHLHVATLNHGLRGSAGAEDARFVEAFSQALSIPVTAGYTDVRTVAETQGLGVEAAARSARYRFLAEVALEHAATHIAVGHHRDDQAETVLMHILRGAGIDGLAGMAACAPMPGWPELTLIRPLLHTTRAELEQYCAEHGLTPRQDLSNEDTSILRNRLRREILPALTQLNPQLSVHLTQLADVARVESDFVRAQFDTTVKPHVIASDERVQIDRHLFKQLHPALQRRWVRWAAARLGQGTGLEPGYIQITGAVEVACHSQVGSKALLQGGLYLRVDYEQIVVEHALPDANEDMVLLPPDVVLPVTVPGVTSTPLGWSLLATPTHDNPNARIAVPTGAGVVLRTRRAGDRFAPLGMNGHQQTLKKWMIDHKVPQHIRERVPLLVVNGAIAVIMYGKPWVVSERFAVRKDRSHKMCFIAEFRL